MVKEQLQKELLNRVLQSVGRTKEQSCEKMMRKKEALAKSDREIVRTKAIGSILRIEESGYEKDIFYQVHLQYLINHKGDLYIEEELETRFAKFLNGEKIEDWELGEDVREEAGLNLENESNGKKGLGTPLEKFFSTFSREDPWQSEIDSATDESSSLRKVFYYDRLKAVKYAERWWNEFNPAYRSFDVNCTNYVSQCLHAGGAPMLGYPHRGKGWWMMNQNWSYSWTVAHALATYLPNAKIGVRAKMVTDPRELKLGDVICYDFQGDGRFDHTTVVTGKDKDGYPLVNANSANSRMRYWAYEDSTAYTPNIKYKFLHIIDDHQ